MTARKKTTPAKRPSARKPSATTSQKAATPKTKTYKMRRSQVVPLIDTLLEKHGNYLQIIAAEEGIIPQSSRVLITVDIVGQEAPKK